MREVAGDSVDVVTETNRHCLHQGGTIADRHQHHRPPRAHSWLAVNGQRAAGRCRGSLRGSGRVSGRSTCTSGKARCARTRTNGKLRGGGEGNNTGPTGRQPERHVQLDKSTHVVQEGARMVTRLYHYCRHLGQRSEESQWQAL